MSSSSQLVILSVDGMPPAFYLEPDRFRLQVPHLRRLVAGGTYAEAVESVYPSTTYPSHASLVTGRRPKDHGVYSHLASQDPTQDPRLWVWSASSIRVPTLWERAKARGLTVGALSWPVTVGASLDWDLPEVWDPRAPDPYRDLSAVARHATPGLLPEILGALGNRKLDPTADSIRTDALVYLLGRYHPDLLLAHWVGFDQAAHRFGPFSPEALAAVEAMDAEVGRIRKVLASTKTSTLVVLSDHGFLPVSKEVAPNMALMQEGLFGVNADGSPQLKRLGTIHAGGCFAIYWLDEPDAQARRALERVIQRLSDTGAVASVIDRTRLNALGADPEAEWMLEAAPSFYYSNRFQGELVRDPGPDRGAHGHLPSTPGMEGSFLMEGPGIRCGASLGRIQITDLFNILARTIGLEPETVPADLS